MKQFVAGPNEQGMRLSRFVQRVTAGLPGPAMYRHFRHRRVKVNGKRAAPESLLSQGDVVELYLNDEYFPAPAARPLPPAAQLPDFGTVYEDAGIAVLYKPAGVLSHKGGGPSPSLLDAFTAALLRRGEYRPDEEHHFAPALCNRLDRGTEGLLLAAKTAAALRDANEIIRLGLLTKDYLCVCCGAPPQGQHQAWLTRRRAGHSACVTAEEAEGAKPIRTGVEVLERKGGLSLCRVRLYTGRSHQIRAHLAFLGAPLYGDVKYGGKSGLGHPALCAWRLAFAQALPPQSSLAALAGRSFTAEQAALPGWWESFK